MRLSSVRALKQELIHARATRPEVPAAAVTHAARVTRSALPEVAAHPVMALGVAGKGREYQLAVRIQEVVPGSQDALDRIRKRARGEVDVRMVGKVVKQVPWHRKKNRPLRVGGSIGHVRVTAGTLGCFVARSSGPQRGDFILSNNHVLANENDAVRGDSILQPGRADGGTARTSVVAELSRFVRLRPTRNLVDAAIAELIGGLEYYPDWLTGLGDIRPPTGQGVELGGTVYKLGRTTGLTRGEVTAIEVDGLRVEYDAGVLSFDNQFEIAPADGGPFSAGGDSGSLIVDSRHRAVGLLFAGNDVNSTYANPVDAVFEILRIQLA